MIFETSLQARFLIPMAISLGFGILFATLIALVIVPCLYLALVDVKRRLGFESEAVIVGPATATPPTSVEPRGKMALWRDSSTRPVPAIRPITSCSPPSRGCPRSDR